jgi:uncharacterized protein
MPAILILTNEAARWTGNDRFEHDRGLKMARIEFTETAAGGSGIEADLLFELGMMHATGRDCEMDFVAAHKWFNIAAIKGSDRAAAMRAELAASMNKAEIARALRDARQWMTVH